ncbi:hypothetical protein CMUS01_02572 [Colletotrichum musicola]|uniref:Uncharacterized protein n=1 Tax=Colletotrichum musicola TaxID=2175873 RepID=A0A8H6NV56_9PEZI|nr:hypothetical protein CMUS01_02572 [Colletotrichum musicola]
MAGSRSRWIRFSRALWEGRRRTAAWSQRWSSRRSYDRRQEATAMGSGSGGVSRDWEGGDPGGRRGESYDAGPLIMGRVSLPTVPVPWQTRLMYLRAGETVREVQRPAGGEARNGAAGLISVAAECAIRLINWPSLDLSATFVLVIQVLIPLSSGESVAFSGHALGLTCTYLRYVGPSLDLPGLAVPVENQTFNKLLFVLRPQAAKPLPFPLLCHHLDRRSKSLFFCLRVLSPPRCPSLRPSQVSHNGGSRLRLELPRRPAAKESPQTEFLVTNS